MITTFNCSTTNCPNAGIDYNFDEVVGTVQCGGCGVVLEPVV